MAKRFHEDYEVGFRDACKHIKEIFPNHQDSSSNVFEVLENRASGANWVAENGNWKCASGVHALQNAQIMLDEYLKKPKEFPKQFFSFKKWCDWSTNNLLRTDLLAEKFAIGFLHHQFDKLIVVDKIKPENENLLDQVLKKLCGTYPT